MAKIKHIAIRTHDIEKTAAFYKEAFGLEQVGVGQSGIYLTDGYLNIAILSMRGVVEGETMKFGVDHVGFQVDDVDAAVEKFAPSAANRSTNATKSVTAIRPSRNPISRSSAS